jgi:hypothetical protein
VNREGRCGEQPFIERFQRASRRLNRTPPYPNNVKNPRIEILCYQGGSLVYGAAGGVTDSFLLGGAGSIWLTFGGSADCTANLFYFGFHAGRQTYNPLATTSFAAGG